MRNWLRRTIGVLALGGGVLGCTIIATTLFSDQPLLSRVLLLLFFPVYAFGIWCGMQMLERHPDAIHTNLLFWAIQVPVLRSSWFSYVFASGALCSVGVQFSPAKLDALWWLGSRFEVTINQPKPFAIGINLLAAAITFILWRQRSVSCRQNRSGENG